MATLIYAELLTNIRQISIIAVLPTACNASTQVKLSGDGRQFNISHENRSTVLNLPGQVNPNIQLPSPTQGSEEVSWRLPVVGQPKRTEFESVDSPWPAAALGSEAEFLCSGCNTPIIRKSSIKTWKDLPSQNWAEMMDFWHCHKPSLPKGPGNVSDSDPTISKGYGANTKFTAQRSVGFVDLTSFLLTKFDCTGIEAAFASQESAHNQPLSCKTCKKYIGHADNDAEGYRLYKWRLKTSDYEPSMPSIISAQLQSLMLAQCSSRLLLAPMKWKQSTGTSTSLPLDSATAGSKPTFLKFWILSPTIRYSAVSGNEYTEPNSISDSASSPSSSLAMKIFWQEVLEGDAQKLMSTDGVEEVYLPQETILEIESDLRKSISVLPESGRTFQQWKVGLLERFEQNSWNTTTQLATHVF